MQRTHSRLHPRTRRRRHWSDAYRNERYAPLQPDAQFDYIIASDCLYFASQEKPLLAVLQVHCARARACVRMRACVIRHRLRRCRGGFAHRTAVRS
jgi:hypothetical protein